MELNAGDNRKAVFFFLWLVDFIVAAQVMAVPLFSQNIFIDQDWIMKSFLLAAGLSFLFLSFFNIFLNRGGVVGLVQPGLFFLASGALVGFLAKDFNLFIFGRILSGLGAAMVIVGQLEMIWHSNSRESKKIFFLITSAFFLGSSVGPILIDFLSGPSFSGIKTFFVLGMAILMVAALEANRTFGKIKGSPSHLQGKKKKLAIMGVGYLGNAIIVYGFDYFLYPYVIWKFGILKGGVVMALLSFAICYITIIFYDWAKQDWLGIEIIKEVKEYNGKSMIGRFTSWILKKSEPVVLVFLSIKFDPFITTAYMRKGAEKYNGLGKRDWIIFLSSLVVGNVYWTFVAFTGVSVIEYAWNNLLAL